VANTEYMRSLEIELQVKGMTLGAGRVLAIAPDDMRASATTVTPEPFVPQEHGLAAGDARWRVPPRSVSVVVVEMREVR
jgi:hypothetical protein